MNTNTTNETLRNAVTYLNRRCKEEGLIPEGKETYYTAGKLYRIHLRVPAAITLDRHPLGSYLGNSLAEAATAVRHLTTAVDAMARVTR